MAIRRWSFWGGWWGGRAGLIDEGFKTVTNKTLDQERDAVDHITECMFSVDFLKSISDAIFEHRSELTVGQFYDTWFKATGSTRKVLIPFNPGIGLALLYVGILFAKENWFDLVPDVELSKSDPAWGLKNAAVTAPTIKIRRFDILCEGSEILLVTVHQSFRSRTTLQRPSFSRKLVFRSTTSTCGTRQTLLISR